MRKAGLHIALAGVSLALMNLSFVREGMTVADALPEMLSLDAWQPVWPYLALIACATVTLLAYARKHSVRLRRSLFTSIQLATATAAFATLGYDALREHGQAWLPSIAGCHCWLTAAAGSIAAILMAIVVVLGAACTFEVVVRLTAPLARYCKRANPDPASIRETVCLPFADDPHVCGMHGVRAPPSFSR